MITLRPLLKSNLNLYRNWRNDKAVMDWCRQTDFVSEFGQEKWFDRIMQDQSIKMYEIIVSESLDLPGDRYLHYPEVGVCGFTSITPTHNTAEFSIYVGKEHQRKGYGREALKALIAHGFNNLNFNRIWGESFEGNPASSLYQKLGFTKEGELRETYYKNGKYINSSIWSLLKKDYSI